MENIFDFGLQDYTLRLSGRYRANSVFAVVGDTARRLEVQVLDSTGVVRHTSGLSLRLSTKVGDQATYVDATTIDASKGLYRIDLTNGMLLKPGRQEFQWTLTDASGNKIHSSPFTSVVAKNITEGGSQSYNFHISYRELKENIKEVKDMQKDLVDGAVDSAAIQQNVEERYGQLEEEYAPKLTEVTAQLAHTAQQVGWMDEAFSGLRFIAHRGYSEYYPENTLLAYAEADRAGFYGWELDLQYTSDGVWVNNHDDDVDRTTNGTGLVSTLTLAQIKSFDIDGGNNASLFNGLKVPTVEEVYDLASKMGHKPLIFLNYRGDTLSDDPKTVALANIIKKYNYEKKTLLFTKSQGSFDGLRKELSSVGICRDFATTAPPTDAQLDIVAAYTPNAMVSILDSILLGANGVDIIQKCKDRNLIIQAHTVNSESTINKLKTLGVNSILTDTVISI